MLPNGRLAWGISAMGLLLLSIAPAPAATPKEIDDSITKVKAFLYTQFKDKDGNWEETWSKPNAAGGGGSFEISKVTGPTALVTYALLAAGESPSEPHIAKALDYLLHNPSDGTYVLGLRCQIWLLLPEDMRKKPEYQKAIEHDGKLLLEGGHEDPTLVHGSSIFYSYLTTDAKVWDHSNSQYGVLGMWACQQCGFEVPQKYWQAVDNGWRQHQFSSGAWPYSKTTGVLNSMPKAPTPMKAVQKVSALKDPAADPGAPMTAAGIATLFITDDYLHGMDNVDCQGNVVDANIDKGLAWMAQNFPDVYENGSWQNAEYTLYGVERIGAASGLKYFGTLDWFKEGSDWLVKNQSPAGSWGGGGPVIGSSFGLLFLARGRLPVVMNKLQYDIDMHGDNPPKKPGNWNERPRDAANLVKWIGKQLEQPWLNWQVVNLQAPVEGLHDAPILYLAGGDGQHLDFTNDEINKLRQYVEDGGLILCNADCGSASFTSSMKKVCQKLFPDYEFRNLPPDSPIYNDEQFPRAKLRSMLQVEALSNGARELVILFSRSDPSRNWQTQTYGGHEELFQFPDDVFLYAIDKGEKGGLRVKGDTYIVLPDLRIQATQTIKVARLQYGGNWNPEPGSWRRLAAVVHNNDKIDLDVQSVKLGEGKLDNTFKVAHLTGTFKFTLTQAARDEINKYVTGGGTLIVDACGGKGDFSASAEKELAAIFPNNPLAAQALPLNNPAFAGGPNLAQVDYRRYARPILGNLHAPRIREININGRSAVFYSAEDLSVGLVGMQIDGIYGYDPASATALMEKLVLFANR